MIEIRLREAIDQHRRRTGERLTYQALAARAGLARSTIESIASRPRYNASLHTIDRICAVLGCAPAELLLYRERAEESADRKDAR